MLLCKLLSLLSGDCSAVLHTQREDMSALSGLGVPEELKVKEYMMMMMLSALFKAANSL